METLDEIVKKAIPIYDKPTENCRCVDCRLEKRKKEWMRQELKQKIQELLKAGSNGKGEGQ